MNPTVFRDAAFSSLYEPVRMLGRGGMGDVSLVRHRVWEMELAAKIVTAGNARVEATTWVRLPLHPNVVTCHYVRTFAETPVLFAELVPGGSLAQALPFPESGDALAVRALQIALGAAHGLAHAHASGVIHQDVKPSNLLLGAEGAKVTDFGVARGGQWVAAPEAALDAPKSLVATALGMTPHYASPEQMAVFVGTAPAASGEVLRGGRITTATDVWSLGATLLEMLLGHASWEVAAADQALSALAGAPADVHAIVTAMLQREPALRPSMPEVIARIEVALRQRGYAPAHPDAEMHRADGHVNRALSELDLARPDDARSHLRAALAIDVCHPEAVYNMALLDWRAGAITDLQALEAVRHAAVVAPSWETRLFEAWIHVERGDERSAWAVLDAVAAEGRGEPRVTRAVARVAQHARDALVETRSVKLQAWPIDAAVLSRDGSRIATAGRDGTISVNDMASGREIADFPSVFAERVGELALSPDERWLYAVSWDHALRVFDLEAREQIFSDSHVGKLWRVVAADDGQVVYVASFVGTVDEWRVEGGTLVRGRELVNLQRGPDLDWAESITDIALSPDQRELYVATEFGRILVLDRASGQSVREFDRDVSRTVYALRFVSARIEDGLLVGDKSQQVALLDAMTGEERRAFAPHSYIPYVVAVSTDGKHLVTGSSDWLTVWELETSRLVRSQKLDAWPSAVMPLSDGTLLVTDESGVLRAMTWTDPAPAPTMLAKPRAASALTAARAEASGALDAVEAHLAAGRVADALSEARRARAVPGFERDARALAVWRALSARCTRISAQAVLPRETIAKVSENLLAAPQFALHDGCIAARDEEGTVLWLSPSTGAIERRYDAFGERAGQYRALACSPDGASLAIGCEGSIHIVGQVSANTAPTCVALPDGGGFLTLVTALDWSAGPFLDARSAVLAVTRHEGIHWIDVDHATLHAIVCPEAQSTDAGVVLDDHRVVVADFHVGIIVCDVRAGTTQVITRPNMKRHITIMEMRVRDGMLFALDGGGLRTFAVPHDGPLALTREIAMAEGTNPTSFDFLDDVHIAVVHATGAVSIWNRSSGTCVGMFENAHSERISAVRAEDSDHILTLGRDEQVRRFRVDWDLVAPR